MTVNELGPGVQLTNLLSFRYLDMGPYSRLRFDLPVSYLMVSYPLYIDGSDIVIGHHVRALSKMIGEIIPHVSADSASA